MKRISLPAPIRAALTASTLSLLVVGCGQAAMPAAVATTNAPAHAFRSEAPEADVVVAEKPENPALARKPGDFVVFRYTGSFRKTPLTLTERVIAREGSVLVIDFTLTEGKKDETLRVRMDFTPGGRGEIYDIARVEKGIEKPATKDAYEAMMAKTIMFADANEEDLGTDDVKIKVGEQTLACKQTHYRVLVGKTSAVMSITQAENASGFAWGDVGGQITGKDGALLYRAELVDMGTAEIESDTVMAKK